MALDDSLRALRELDLNEIDFSNVGGLPFPIKLIVWLVVFGAIVGGGWLYFVQEQQLLLDSERAREQALREEFQKKAYDAANLDALRKQMGEMKQAFGAMVSQLPSDTEVPGLLEDISNRGQTAGLRFSKIELAAERSQEFYVELPIQIEVEGTYHDFGTFVSGVAGLPRIVTMHDFTIASVNDKNAKGAAADKSASVGPLKMTIEARTYRYKSMDDAPKAKPDAKKGAKKAKPAASGSPAEGK